MNSRKLILAGSSFLLPNHYSWKTLQNKYKLEFSIYGDIGGALLKSDSKDIVVIILHLQDIKGQKFQVDAFHIIFSILKKRLITSNAPLIFSICGGAEFNVIRSVKKLQIHQKFYSDLISKLEEFAKLYLNFYFIDFDRQFSITGWDKKFDNRNWYFSHCRFSSLGLNEIAQSLDLVLTRHYSPASKVLLLDCDNTLWGGVVGEDGIDGIILGQDGLGMAYVDFQKEIVRLYNEGVLLVITSKNNEKDVWDVFDNHSAMILKKDMIVAWKIDWKEKSENIISLSQQLDLGLHSFVFWDDNPLERDKVKISIPQVLTINVPDDFLEWPKYLRELNCFAKFQVIKEDLKKTKQYQARGKFIRDSQLVADIDSYLDSINLAPSAQSINKSNIARAAQMCLKTNQFNLRSIRYSEADLLNLSNKQKEFCFLTSLSDVYGDHGIVGLSCMILVNKEIAFIDTFLMSCRVLGRHLESWTLYEMLKRCKTLNIKYLIGEFVPTSRNNIASNFFKEHNFKPLKFNNDLMIIVSKNTNAFQGKAYYLTVDNAKIPYLGPYKKSL
jgi:FkbH-like protein